MMTLIQKIKTAAQNHMRYVDTRDQIAALPLDVALDLGIFREDADKIAQAAIYGIRG